MSRSTEELLYDSEAVLRLVDTALHELQGVLESRTVHLRHGTSDPEWSQVPTQPPTLLGGLQEDLLP